MSMTPITEEAKTAAITLTFDPSKLFDVVAEVGDGGTSLGSRIVGIMLTGGQTSFREDVGLAFYGVSAAPASAAPRADSAERTAGALRGALKEIKEAADDMLNSLPGHWHDDATIRLTDAANDARTALSAAEQEDLYEPAPSSPGVPDSVRAAILAADLHECWVNGDTADVMTSPFPGCGNFDQIVARCATGELWRKRAVAIAEALNFIRTLVSAHPAGQSEGSADAERCIACDKPLKAGERVLSDAEGGTIHTACCGPEREGYTKGDGEPLGPNDPIPQGYVYEPERPAGQSTGQGAEPRRMAEGCCSAVSPCSHQQRDPYSLCAVCQKANGIADKIQAAAPDSTRTGQVETDAKRALDLIWAQIEEKRADLFEEIGFGDGPYRFGDGGKVFIVISNNEARALLAARPAAPEAQGAWCFDMEAAPRDETPVPVSIRSPLDGKVAAGEAAFSIEEQQWRWTDESYRDPIQPYAWFRMPEPPAPPVSSGQESA